MKERRTIANQPAQTAEKVTEVLARPPTDEEKYYLEQAYKNPVESIGQIEEVAKLLLGAVTTVSGLFASAAKLIKGEDASVSRLFASAVKLINGEDASVSKVWIWPFVFWAASILALLAVLFPKTYLTAKHAPDSYREAFLQARKYKYGWLVVGGVFFIVGIMFAVWPLRR